jgi:hypothetical protein
MLSKSDYVQGYLECPCLLWLKKLRPDLIPEDFNADLEHIFEQGRLVDEEAKKLFPGGFEVSDFVFDGWKNTQSALKENHDVLFQPTAVAGEIHARADILTRDGKNWDLREVKSSTGLRDDHIVDLAFQRLCFEGAKVPIGRTFLIHLNNRYVRHGAIEPKKLFKSEDVTEEVVAALPRVRADIKKALAVLDWPKKPGERNVAACVDPAHCEYLGYYLAELPAALRKKLEAERYVAPLPDPAIVTIDQPAIRERLAGLSYPLQYLDYETFSPAIPMFDGYRPYQRIVFQYSLHIQDSPDGQIRHEEFLEDQAVDPTEHLARTLGSQVEPGGTFVAWNASFEKGCNSEMGERAPKFAKLFQSVNERMFDPMWLFKKRGGVYCHSGFCGSASLKKVLPVLVPELSYKELEIQEGGTASESWPILTDPKLPAVKRNKLRQDMLKYCGLDTLAMVRILEHLKEVSRS